MTKDEKVEKKCKFCNDPVESGKDHCRLHQKKVDSKAVNIQPSGYSGVKAC